MLTVILLNPVVWASMDLAFLCAICISLISLYSLELGRLIKCLVKFSWTTKDSSSFCAVVGSIILLGEAPVFKRGQMAVCLDCNSV